MEIAWIKSGRLSVDVCSSAMRHRECNVRLQLASPSVNLLKATSVNGNFRESLFKHGTLCKAVRSFVHGSFQINTIIETEFYDAVVHNY